MTLARARLLASAVSVALAAACAPPVPEHPTWFQDVQPLVQANCGRCHGPDPSEPEIAGFRLDRYVQGDGATLDAWDYREDIVHRAVDLQAPVMPPSYPLSPRQKELLRRWVEQGAPKGTRDNRPPQVELVAPAEPPGTADQSLDVTVRSWDGDADGLWVQLLAREEGSADEWPLSPPMGQGQRRVVADTGVLPSGRVFEVIAALDDGYGDDPALNRTEVVLIDALLVDHGARGSAPLVRLLEPNGGATLFGAVTVAWSASDPDPGDSLSIDLDLYRYSDTAGWGHFQVIASGLPGSTQSYQWTPGAPASDPSGDPYLYRLRVTARDVQGNARFDESDAPFSLAPPPQSTTLTWDDVRPTLVTYCAEACHGQPARSPALEYFRLDKYDAADPVAPVTADEGVYEVRGAVYQKAIADGSMPPRSQPQPTAAQLNALREWLLGGAPRGGTPANAAPVITWSTPNDAAVSRSAGGAITLSWSAVDPEGAPVTGPVSWVVIQARTDAQARCDGTLTGWTPLAGAGVADGTAPFTLPPCAPSGGNNCYWCFRAEASDGVNTAVKVAGRPVR